MATRQISWRQSAGALATAVGLVAAPHSVALAFDNTCGVWQTSSLNFGAYDPLSAVPDDAVGSASVWCTSSPSQLEFAMDSLQSDGTRRIYSGANYLTYNIYSDVARTLVIGSGSNGTQTYKRSNPGQISTTYFYGRIPAGQDVPAGTYTDTVVITVNF